jgi:uncharacterized protein (DUF1499 family)
MLRKLQLRILGVAAMSRSRLSIALSLILSLLCWLNLATPTLAQPSIDKITQTSTHFTSNTGFAQAFMWVEASVFTKTSSGGTPLFSFSGKPPTDLGVKQGKLLACPNTPNCVSSQSTDAASQIEPLAYSGDSAQALANLKSVIEAMPRTQIITATNNYIYAEFTSALMGFVDDVEFYLDDAAGMIHVRSASRLGQSDLGVNRKRVEEIRSKFAEKS